jgi:hypothetical protein
MISKVVRMFIGRSVARRNGFSGFAGAAVALIAPVVLKKAGGAISRKRAAKKARREEERMPKYVGPVTDKIRD